ncbi:MAG: SPOR domain-containing protein [Actinomycetales bacterium]
MDGQWWFNLRTQKVEQGQGDPNSERLGPYDTRAEAEGVLERMRKRNEAFDEQEDA